MTTTINSEDVRIPRSARDAVARHEEVVVLNHDRPAFVIINPEDHPRAKIPTGRGKPLRESTATLLAAPLPDPDFARDMGAVIASVGTTPGDPWERS